MTKSELIEQISVNYPDMTKKQVEFIINNLFLVIKEALACGEDVEIRGFGSFRIRVKKPKTARNPKTGAKVDVPERKTPFFRAGKEIKEALIKL